MPAVEERLSAGLCDWSRCRVVCIPGSCLESAPALEARLEAEGLCEHCPPESCIALIGVPELGECFGAPGEMLLTMRGLGERLSGGTRKHHRGTWKLIL